METVSGEEKKTLTILCVGDPHFQETNKLTTDELVEKVIVLVKERSPDYVVIMGDTLHRFKTINQFAANDAIRFFNRLAVLTRLFVLIGNHDRPTPDDFLSDDHAFFALEDRKDMTIVSQPIAHYDERLQGYLLFVPFVPPQRFGEALQRFEPDHLSNCRMLFCHQEFRDSEYRVGLQSTHGDEWASYEFPIISGHIHKYQRLGDRLIYVGTPYQENFGETDPKSVSLITVESDATGTFDEERIFLECRPKKEIIIQANRLSSFSYDPSSDWKVVLKGTYDALSIAQTSRLFGELQLKGVVFDQIATDDTISTAKLNDDLATEETERTIPLLEELKKEIENRPALEQILLELLREIDGAV